MKKLVALALIICMVAFCFTLSGCVVNAVGGDFYDRADEYLCGDFDYSPVGITKVELNWISGNVEIVTSENQTLKCTESSSGLKDKEKVHHLIDGDTLKIQFWQSGLRVKLNGKNKKLRLEVPKGVSIKVNSVSAKVLADSLDGTDIGITSVSGAIEINSIKATTVSLETVSGAIDVGAFDGQSLDLETVSGKMNIGLNSCNLLFGESVSGSLTLSLNGIGANVRFSSVSGKCTDESNSANMTSKCQIDFDSVSGNLKIK